VHRPTAEVGFSFSFFFGYNQVSGRTEEHEEYEEQKNLASTSQSQIDRMLTRRCWNCNKLLRRKLNFASAFLSSSSTKSTVLLHVELIGCLVLLSEEHIFTTEFGCAAANESLEVSFELSLSSSLVIRLSVISLHLFTGPSNTS